MRVIVLTGICNLLSFTILGQKTYNTHRVDQIISIDGELDEQLWSEADIATDFTTSRPVFGNISIHKSIVKIVYDDEAIYVAGEMHDPEPDSVNYNLSQRDDYGNSDWFRINIDPYGNAITAYSFGVTSVGVEVDGIEGTDGGPGFGDIDKTWNDIWRSAAKKTEYGWSFEM